MCTTTEKSPPRCCIPHHVAAVKCVKHKKTPTELIGVEKSEGFKSSSARFRFTYSESDWLQEPGTSAATEVLESLAAFGPESKLIRMEVKKKKKCEKRRKVERGYV